MINKKNVREKQIIIFEIRQSFPNLNSVNHPVAINLMCPYHLTDKYHWQHETHWQPCINVSTPIKSRPNNFLWFRIWKKKLSKKLIHKLFDPSSFQKNKNLQNKNFKTIANREDCKIWMHYTNLFNWPNQFTLDNFDWLKQKSLHFDKISDKGV